jgi:rifampicin phosphotransferase
VAGGSLILGLEAVTAAMVPVVGGKAANLGELLAAGLPVPGGFCLTTAAYRQATAGQARAARLGAVHDALQNTGDDDLPALAALAGQARDAIRAARVPPDITAAIEAAYAALGTDVPVAVRSSATAEDLPSASFAGQQDTYLNVVGAAAVVDAVRDCWASLWTDRAVSYRATRGINPAAVALAVVVQRMVDATAAGVLFTANPITNRRQQAVIDASPGLGEAVVSGAVNPDHFVVDPVTGRVLERRLGDKLIAVRPLAGGGTHTVAASNGGAAACLTDRQAAELAALGRRVEQHFAAPQDIEWAIDGGGRLWLTQSRPITTLFPVPQRPSAKELADAVEADQDGRLLGAPAGAAAGAAGGAAAGDKRSGTRVYLCLSLAQGLTRPLTPMGLAAFRLITSSAARAAHFDVPQPHNGPSPYAEAGQRMYFDLTAVARSATGRRIVPRVFDVMEARSATVLRTVFEDPRFSVTRRTPLSLLRHLAPIAVRGRVPAGLLRATLRPDTALRRTNRQAREFRDSLQLSAGATALQRIDHAEHVLGGLFFSVVPSILPLPVLGFASLALVGKLLGGDRWDELQVVLRGLPNNVTTEMDLELWRLAQVIRNDGGSRTAMTGRKPAELAGDFRAGQLPSVLQAGLARFMDQYGHRAVAEIDVGMPRWSDDPTHIIGVLANYLRLDAGSVPPDVQFSNAAEDAEAQIGRLVAEARGQGRLRGAVVKAALRRARLFTGLRELPKFQLVVALAEVRKQLLLVGTALTAAGAFDAPDDVFFLDLEEARAGLRRVAEGGPGGKPGTGRIDLRGLVAERREAYGLELARRHVPRVLLSDGTEPEAVHPAGASGEAAQAGVLTGSPASAGTVTAAARVILDPVGAHLEPGEILVAPSTDPGWTPLFLTAGGLVMEMGGANSHGAVVAREYGIPAVVGVPDATLRLTTGQQITVDGGAGTVVSS